MKHNYFVIIKRGKISNKSIDTQCSEEWIQISKPKIASSFINIMLKTNYKLLCRYTVKRMLQSSNTDFVKIPLILFVIIIFL